MAIAGAVVGIFCTTLAFAPGLYFKAETAPEPAHPAPVTTDAVMIAAPSADYRSERAGSHFVVASGAASTDRAIQVVRPGLDRCATYAAAASLGDPIEARRPFLFADGRRPLPDEAV
jgi:hypothetical protein